MKNYMKWALALCLTASIGYAVQERVDKYGGQYPVWLNKGIYVGPNVPDPTTTTTNKVTRMLSASSTIDFASATIVCRDSTPFAVTGAQVGDPCFVGMPATLTAGGTGLHETFSCYVSSAGNAVVRACAAGTADDPPSVAYNVRIISNI